MSTTSDGRPESSTPRREFLGQFAASAIVLAGAACAAPASTVGAATVPSGMAQGTGAASTTGQANAPAHWDDSWFGRLTAKHKAVFDSPQIEDGLVLANAAGYINGMRDAIGAAPNDVQAVIVIRHAAIAMAFNDAMWAKYELGKDKNIKAPRSEDWVTRNPYLTGRGGGRGGDAAANRAQGNLSWLSSNGHVLIGCDLAARNYAGQRARALKLEQAAVYEDFRANLVPGVILQPTGVYAALRAQEAGCAYIRST